MVRYVSVRGQYGPTVDDFIKHVREQPRMESSSFIQSLNSGSLRKLGEKTGTGMVNRFGPQIRQSLNKTGWDGGVSEVKCLVGEVLTAIGPAVMVEVMAFLGYEYDPTADEDEGPIAVYEVGEEV